MLTLKNIGIKLGFISATLEPNKSPMNVILYKKEDDVFHYVSCEILDIDPNENNPFLEVNTSLITSRLQIFGNPQVKYNGEYWFILMSSLETPEHHVWFENLPIK